MTRGAQRRVCLLVRPASSPGRTCSPLELPPPPGLETAQRSPPTPRAALSLPPCPVLPSAQPWDAGQRGGPGLRPPPPSAPRWETLPAHGLLSPFFVLRSQRPETGIILDLPSAGDQPASTSATFPFSQVQTPAPLRSHRHSCSSSGLSNSLLIISASTGSPCSLSTQKPASTF